VLCTNGQTNAVLDVGRKLIVCDGSPRQGWGESDEHHGKYSGPPSDTVILEETFHTKSGRQLSTRFPCALQGAMRPVPKERPTLARRFNAGEVVADYPLRLKRKFDLASVWIITHANNVPCYIPPGCILDLLSAAHAGLGDAEDR
jgi:hypothetical protein